jgi:hypothetical protein
MIASSLKDFAANVLVLKLSRYSIKCCMHVSFVFNIRFPRAGVLARPCLAWMTMSGLYTRYRYPGFALMQPIDEWRCWL